MKFPLWFNAAIHSAVLHGLQLHTQSPSFKNSASLSLPQHQILLNLYHNASFKIFLYVLHVHLYPPLAMVRLPFNLPIWTPFILPVRLALYLSHCFKGSCLHFCLREQGRKKKLLQALPGWDLWSGLGSPHQIWFTSHSSGLLNFLHRHRVNVPQLEESGDVYQTRNPTRHFAYSPGFATSHKTLHPSITSTFLLKTIYSWCLNVVTDLCECLLLGFSTMEATLTTSLLITWGQKLNHRKWQLAWRIQDIPTFSLKEIICIWTGN